MPKPAQAQEPDLKSKQSSTFGIKLYKFLLKIKWPIILTLILFLLAPHYANYVNKDKNEALVKEIEDLNNKLVQESSFPSDIDENAREKAEQLLNSTSHYEKGLAETYLGNYASAESEFSMAIEMPTAYLSKCYLQRGNERHISHNFTYALEDYNNVTRLDPENLVAWNSKGVVLFNLGKYEDALNAYYKAIEIDPKYAFAWNNIANALMVLGSYDEALSDFEKAIELDPIIQNHGAVGGLS
jgi:tetratricopeptide (TPR) repeat protein